MISFRKENYWYFSSKKLYNYESILLTITTLLNQQHPVEVFVSSLLIHCLIFLLLLLLLLLRIQLLEKIMDFLFGEASDILSFTWKRQWTDMKVGWRQDSKQFFCSKNVLKQNCILYATPPLWYRQPSTQTYKHML